MKKDFVCTSGYFYGNKVSDYGIKNGYIDYGTLSKAFGHVLNNEIMNTKIVDDWEQESGFIDNTDAINELKEKLGNMEYTEETSKQYSEIESEIEELENENYMTPEIYQYYIISESGAEMLKELTNEIIFYSETLGMYVWGVTHYGTSWDYVLTDIPVKLKKESEEE